MLRRWRTAPTWAKVLITAVLLMAGGFVISVGVELLQEQRTTSGAPPSVTVVPSRTRTETVTLPAGNTPIVSTVTITEPASTVLITSSTKQSSGDNHDAIAVAWISAGSAILVAAITAASTVFVATIGKHT